LPESWTSNARLRQECHIPEEIEFKTKEELALAMITRAVEAGIPGDIVLADSWYGRSRRFRETVRSLGLDYALAIKETLKMWRLDKREQRIGDAKAASDLAEELKPKAFRRVTWRDGTMPDRRKLSSRFAFCRVKVAHDDGSDAAA
jgi:SRSO17 transposase